MLLPVVGCLPVVAVWCVLCVVVRCGLLFDVDVCCDMLIVV